MTRIVDVCFKRTGCNVAQFLYFSLFNVNPENPQSLNIDHFILGNTADFASSPQRVYFEVRSPADFDRTAQYYKNFDCRIFGQFYFLRETRFYGRCTSQCPSGFYISTAFDRCLPCPSDCAECADNETCLSCRATDYLIEGRCQRCIAPCRSCEGGP